MELEKLVEQNPWWHDINWVQKDRQFILLNKMTKKYDRSDYIELKEGVIIFYGPRQIGKTTWIKTKINELLKTTDPQDIFYLNAETQKDRFELLESIKFVWGLYNPKYLFIDEINSITDWEITIKVLIDSGTFETKYVLLTGSSSINILKKAERLPGRLAKGNFKTRYYSLNFREVLKLYNLNPTNIKDAISNLTKINNVFYKYLIHGGYIRAINDFEQKEKIEEDLFSIYSAWIDGEISKDNKSSELTTNILDGIVNTLTNDTSWGAITTVATHPTIQGYSETLKNMFVIEFLEKSRRSLTGAPKNKKIYFMDPFLYWLTLFKSRKINFVNITNLDSQIIGKLAEQSFFTNILQYLDTKLKENDFDIRRYLFYEKGRSGETDFVLKLKNKSYFLEIKFRNNFKEKDGIIYLTKDKLDKNKLPLAIFLIFPEECLKLIEKN